MKKILVHLFFIVFILVIINCSSKKRIDTCSVNGQWFISKDETKINNEKVTESFEKNKLLNIDSLGIDSLASSIKKLIKIPYNVFFYTLCKKIQEVQPFIVFVYSNDYTPTYLISMRDCRLIDKVELSKKYCDLQSQDKDREVSICQNKKAIFLNDSSLVVRDSINIKYNYVKKDSVFMKIEIKDYHYRIKSDGLIDLIKIDTI